MDVGSTPAASGSVRRWAYVQREGIMVALLLVGLFLVALATLPRCRRPLLLLLGGGLLCSAGAATATGDGFVIAAAGLVPALAGLVVREIADTMRLAGKARRADRRYAERKRLAQEREYERRRDERRAA